MNKTQFLILLVVSLLALMLLVAACNRSKNVEPTLPPAPTNPPATVAPAKPSPTTAPPDPTATPTPTPTPIVPAFESPLSPVN